MLPVRRESAQTSPPAPGIYHTGGTVRGEVCLIAYDDNGECRTECGIGAYQRLEVWLTDRGVRLPSSRPALFLV